MTTVELELLPDFALTSLCNVWTHGHSPHISAYFGANDVRLLMWEQYSYDLRRILFGCY